MPLTALARISFRTLPTDPAPAAASCAGSDAVVAWLVWLQDVRLTALVEGVLAGNIFDWGSAACVELYQSGTILDIYRMSRNKLKRPWKASRRCAPRATPSCGTIVSSAVEPLISVNTVACMPALFFCCLHP